MKELEFELGCDTAHFAVADFQFFEHNKAFYGPTAKRMCKVIDVEPGRYEITISPFGWDGETSRTETIDVRSGRLFVGDSCYMFSSGECATDFWNDFIALTNLDFVQERYFAINTGGDGRFSVELYLKKLD
jgi:hypothetical protein